jgi:phthalate 4,5-dioxygenase oxygenase subunit
MLTDEQNELLTRTGPGTPGGELLRRYWQPAALSEELPPGGAPLAIRLLGEDLVLFRDGSGQPGLLGLHCAHRGADLSYGRLEDGGLRCIYHGWLYDRHGRCLEQPGEPSGSTFFERIRHLAYPCREAGDVIFAYLGPGDPPALPPYGVLTAAEAYRFRPSKTYHCCNYLQANEGNIDPVHLSFLHRLGDRGAYTYSVSRSINLTARDIRPTLEVEETDYGLRIYAVRQDGEGGHYVRITNFVMPNLCALPTQGNGDQVDWHVPIDDVSHWKYTLACTRDAPLEDREIRGRRAAIGPDYHPLRTPENRYQQDREEMRTKTYAGIGTNFLEHDLFAVQGAGEIQDRTHEHLAGSDKAIVMERLMLLKAVHDVQNGRDPAHVIRDGAASDLSHLVTRSEVVPEGVDWRTFWQAAVR